MSVKTASNGHAAAEHKKRLHPVLDPALPFDTRRMLLAEMANDESPASAQMIQHLLEQATAANEESVYKEKIAEAQQLIEQLKSGALRPATFVGLLDAQFNGVPRVRLRLPSGEEVSCLVPDEKLLASLQIGDTVWLDGQMRAVLYRQDTPADAGEVVRFERAYGDWKAVVSARDHDEQVVLMSQALAEKVKAGIVKPGAKLLACTRRRIAFDSLDEESGFAHYRYLSRDPIPDVRIDRDLGDPPAYIGDVVEHVRREMQYPELGRKYGIRRSTTKLLAGVTGSGKTLSIEATIRAVMDAAAEHVGIESKDLPSRVMRLRMATVGSSWFAETERNIDRFFDEAEALSDEKFTGPDGKDYELPLILVLEEADSLGAERNGGEQVYSRVQGTLLQRLDANVRRFGDRLIIVLCTTNVPHLLDGAFLRRVGGTIEHFGRLTRKGTAAVLDKHLARLPLPGEFGEGADSRRGRVRREVLDWLFGQSGDDPPLVEVTYVGSSQPVPFYRRALLTGGLIDRAAQQAAQAGCRREAADGDDAGVTCELLIEALDRQIRSMVGQLNEHNVGNHLTLPHGARVAQVRRLDAPPLSRRDLQRN